MQEKVRYFWSKNRKGDLCDKTIIQNRTDNLCYHCEKIIPANSHTVCLTTDRGEQYLLHEDCAAGSCISLNSADADNKE